MFAELNNVYVDEGAKWFKRPRFGDGTMKNFQKESERSGLLFATHNVTADLQREC
jgi:hypothetical protein